LRIVINHYTIIIMHNAMYTGKLRIIYKALYSHSSAVISTISYNDFG